MIMTDINICKRQDKIMFVDLSKSRKASKPTQMAVIFTVFVYKGSLVMKKSDCFGELFP